MRTIHCSIVIPFLCLLFVPCLAFADLVKVDLNDFYADPTVTVAADGLSADFTEGGFFGSILSNDPFFGDPEVIFAEIGGIGQILSFDYDFDEPAGNADEFGAFVIDTVTGGSVGPSFEFFTQVTSSGTVRFDLSSLSGAMSSVVPGQPVEPLGLQFQLSHVFVDMGGSSTLTISNVTLVPVPVPGAVLLAVLGLGASAFGICRKKRKLQK